MDRRLAWVLGIIFGGGMLCFLALMFVIALAVRDEDGMGGGANRVGVIEIRGAIDDSKETLKSIRAFKEDDSLKAVVIRVDSPGGAVGPSQEIFEAVRELAKTKKVVASMGALAASGGYYISCAAEKIYANPGTLTGSLGVVMQIPNVEGVLKWAGVEMRVVTAGKLKDAGSPFRAMTQEERAYFEKILLDVHEQFIEAVASGRKLTPDVVRPYADGRVFTGRQAKELKLVDEVGGFNEAVAAAAKLAGISGEPKLHYPKEEKKFLRDLLRETSSSFAGEAIRQLGGGAGLQYRMPLFETSR
jgi:protease IV